ncbi:MAG: hypothetical protein J6J87_07220, partial [Oscillospiraceae bacterium]|nr:hypothetical protein [Oscillospiraceae bacterium]
MDHTWSTGDDIKVFVEPRCQVVGTGYHYCTVCGEKDMLHPVTIPKLGHDFVLTKNAVDPGSIAGYDLDRNHTVRCTRCGVFEVRDHKYVKTCIKHEYCSVCGHKKVNGELGLHTPDSNWSYDETNHWHKCVGDVACTKRFDEAAHTWARKDDTYVDAPDCTTDGTAVYVCTCGAEKTQTVPDSQLGHEWATEWSKDEINHWHVCTREGCNEINEVAAHTWTRKNDTYERAPGCTTDGTAVYVCTCGAEKTQT